MPGDICLFAHTESGAPTYPTYRQYPAYINVTRREKDGMYLLSVRSRDTCSAGYIELTPAQWATFKSAINDAP